MSDLLSTAVQLVEEQGWYVFRMRIGHNESECDGGTANCKKVDFLGQHWKETSSNDLDIIRSWDWSHANAYGIDCGKSGIVVADEDPGDRWPFNGTRVHSSGRGKHHIYEDYIGCGNRASVAHYGVDVRGVGGLIIGPGSWHPHGEYAVLDDSPVAPAPRELIEAAPGPSKARSANPGPIHPLDMFEALSRLDGVYARMAATPDGQRNDMLNKLAGTAAGIWVRVPDDERTGLLSEESIQQRLLDSVPDDGDPEKSEGTIRSGWEYGLAHPVPDKGTALTDLFEQTPTLRHIRQAAHSRMVSAPALLCYSVGRVLAELPPAVMLPAVIGGKASLNLGVAVVGGSGAGKSSLLEVSRDLLGLTGGWQEDIERSPGSGEGLVQSFLRWDNISKSHVLMNDPRRILTVDEVDSLGATKSRNGSTIAPTLRTALTGGPMGQANATADRTRHVNSGTYRLVLFLGVQPTRSDTLLEDADAGTPQRLVWVRATDDTVPDEDQDWPGVLPGWEDAELSADPRTIDYPDHIKALVRSTRRNQLRGRETDPLAGHKLLLRLKVAAGLALLHHELDITEQWWELAGGIIDASMAVQAECRRALSEDAAVSRRNAGRLDAIREEGAAEYRDERAVKAAVAVWKQVHKHSTGAKDANQRHEPEDGCTTRCVTNALRNFADREELRAPAVEHAADADWIEEKDGRWFPGDSRPA